MAKSSHFPRRLGASQRRSTPCSPPMCPLIGGTAFTPSGAIGCPPAAGCSSASAWFVRSAVRGYLMLDWLWNLWRAMMRVLLREPVDESEEGPIEGALQIGCLIVALFVGIALVLIWLSR